MCELVWAADGATFHVLWGVFFFDGSIWEFVYKKAGGLSSLSRLCCVGFEGYWSVLSFTLIFYNSSCFE